MNPSRSRRTRFLERIDEPDNNWKFSRGAMHERKYWKKYLEAYENCPRATSTKHAPWSVVPADDKKDARLIVSQIVRRAFKALEIAHPQAPAEGRKDLEPIRKGL